MKVYISPYRDHWVSPYTIIKRLCFWRVLHTDETGDSWMDEPWAERWAARLEPFCTALQKFLNRIHPQIRYVKIDTHDTWNMDHTLAYIVVPMLHQLKATKHGSGIVDIEDVPESLHPTTVPSTANNYDDETVHQRWDWVLDEMIWAFEQQVKDNDDEKFFDHSGVDTTLPLQQQMQQIKVDSVGLKAHNDRKQNGFRLFGKYYQNLWD